MQVENTVTINRPIKDVFEYVSTPENDPTWVSASLRHPRTSPGPMRVGMSTEEEVKFLGRTSRDTWEITEYEPPTVIAYRATSRVTEVIECAPVRNQAQISAKPLLWMK